MSYQVEISDKASKFLEKHKTHQSSIDEKLIELIAFYDDEEDIPKPDVKKLKGKYEGLFRLRIGKVRVIFKMYRSEEVIKIIDIDNRGDVYK
jgi:mRNA interferase RelE/StbE